VNNDYQINLRRTLDFLNEVEIKLQEHMLNIMMSGELSDWNEQAENGEEIYIDNTLLEASSDINSEL
jgi:hypothetical protein